MWALEVKKTGEGFVLHFFVLQCFHLIQPAKMPKISLHTDHICASTDINFPSVPLPTSLNSDVVLLFRSSINFKAILFKNIGWALTLLGTPSTDIARYGPAPPLAAMAPQSNHSLAICWTKTAQRAPWQPPYQIQLLSPSFLLVLIFQGDPCLRGCLHWHESEMCDCV